MQKQNLRHRLFREANWAVAAAAVLPRRWRVPWGLGAEEALPVREKQPVHGQPVGPVAGATAARSQLRVGRETRGQGQAWWQPARPPRGQGAPSAQRPSPRLSAGAAV